jgi:hypothetical protein
MQKDLLFFFLLREHNALNKPQEIFTSVNKHNSLNGNRTNFETSR